MAEFVPFCKLFLLRRCWPTCLYVFEKDSGAACFEKDSGERASSASWLSEPGKTKFIGLLEILELADFLILFCYALFILFYLYVG